ncbi:MAG: response regulator transcription factor [Oscillospiraceae bacterium]
MNVLIVEDEPALADALSKILTTTGYYTDTVHNGNDALSYAASLQYDLIILDVMMSGMDGFSVARELRRQKCDTPILMLTALRSTDDKVSGLEAGADDYMTKPFETAELLARVKALTRRKGTVIMDEIAYGGLILELTSGVLRCGDRSVQLSRRELDVARMLFERGGKTVTKNALLYGVWGGSAETSENSVEAYISFLRKKLRFLQADASIRNIQRIGYRLEAGEC